MGLQGGGVVWVWVSVCVCGWVRGRHVGGFRGKWVGGGVECMKVGGWVVWAGGAALICWG